MNEFEQWFLQVVGIADEQVGILVDAFQMHDWLPSYKAGLSPTEAVTQKLGCIES